MIPLHLHTEYSGVSRQKKIPNHVYKLIIVGSFTATKTDIGVQVEFPDDLQSSRSAQEVSEVSVETELHAQRLNRENG